MFFLASSESLLSHFLLANLDLETGREFFLCGDPLPSARPLDVPCYCCLPGFILENGCDLFLSSSSTYILRTYESYFEYFKVRNCDEVK